MATEINNHLPQHVLKFCSMFPPSARLCRIVNRRSRTFLDVQPDLNLSIDHVPQVVGNSESAGVRYWLITPYGSGQAIVPVPKDEQIIVCYLTPSTTHQEISVTVSPFPTSWILMPISDCPNEKSPVVYTVPQGSYEWTCLINWPHFSGDEGRMLDLGTGDQNSSQKVVIHSFEHRKQAQYWSIQFIRHKPTDAILPILPCDIVSTHPPAPHTEDTCKCNSGPHGVVPSPPDPRDHIFVENRTAKPGQGVDLRHNCPPIWNQGSMGSCTAHAVAAAFEFDVHKQGLPAFSPSRLFVWYHARAKSSEPKAVLKNCGSNIRNAIKSLSPQAYGVCGEVEWPYEVDASDEKTHFFVLGSRAAVKPTPIVYDHAHKHTAVNYYAIQGQGLIQKLVNCLDQGYPFILGLKTYGLLSNSEIKKTGTLRMPTAEEVKKPEHLHAVLTVGYNPQQKRFIVRNSWGVNWGDKGYFTMPYDFAVKYGFDIWTIRLVNTANKGS